MMADADARKAAIKKASSQVRSGVAFVRRASSEVSARPIAKSVQTTPKKLS
jgi:hypothetical protein